MLRDRCLVCLSVCPVLSLCNVGVLWPNGQTDQDATWYEGRPRPRRHSVRRGPGSSKERGTAAPQFSAHLALAWSPISATADLLLTRRSKHIMHLRHKSNTKPRQSTASELSRRICENLTGHSGAGWEGSRPSLWCWLKRGSEP